MNRLSVLTKLTRATVLAAVLTGVACAAMGEVPTTLTLDATPPAVTLGGWVTLSGSVAPAPGAVSVSFDGTTTPPGGTDTRPSATTATAESAFSVAFLPDEAGAWTFSAEWAGDSTYDGDEGFAAVTVEKAQPSLTLTLNASSAAMGHDELEATAVFTAGLPAELEGLYAGLPLKVWIKKPDASTAGPVLGATDGDGVAVFNAAALSSAGIVFNEPGLWQFMVEFEGDDNFLSATSTGYGRPDSTRLAVFSRAGYAIVVVGKYDHNGEGVTEHAKTGDAVYRALLSRGFADEHIYYLREAAQQQVAPDIFVDDTTPSQMDLQWAIETWAADRLTESPAPLYLVLLDHGSEWSFYVYAGSYDETRLVTSFELDSYLDTLEAQLDSAALAEPRVVVCGSGHSGSFIDHVSSENRVVITSCAADEILHRGVIDPLDGVREGELFTREFFRYGAEGKTLKESFELASDQTLEYTATRSNGAVADRPQNPTLDDNGDGVGTVAEVLSFETGHDGARAHGLALGYGVNGGGPAAWVSASGTVVLGPTDPMVQLEARTDDAFPGHTAWLEVKTPSYAGGSVIDPSNPYSQMAVVLPSFAYEAGISDPGTGYYRWETFGTTFDAPGTYKVFYYIQDADTGDISAHVTTTVYRQGAVNQAPPAVTLVYPADGGYAMYTTFLAWNEVTDPDGDDVTYRVEVAEDAAFTTGLQVQEGLETTVTQVTGLADLVTYYWRVVPVDEYGASPASHTVWSFRGDIYGLSPGAVTGVVSDLSTGEGIANATVTLPGQGTATTASDGRYFLSAAAGWYTVQASATGYDPQMRTVTVFTSSATTADFQLTSNVQFRWGDVSADAQVGTMDASQVLQWMLGMIPSFPVAPGTIYPAYPACADVSDDATVGTVDASLMLQKKVGLIAAFPADDNGDGFGPDGAKSNATKSVTRPVLVGGWAVQADAVTVRIPADLGAGPDDVISIPVSVDAVSGLVGYYFELAFDGAVLSYEGVSAGSLTASWGTPSANPQTGIVRVAAAGATAVNGAGSLAVIQLRVRADMTDGATSFLNLQGVQLNDGAVSVTTTSGTFEVEVAYDIRAPQGLQCAPDSEFDVDVTVDDADGVVGYYFRMAYDAGVIEYVSATPGGLVAAWGAPTVNAGVGTVSLGGYGATPLATGGSLMTLRFRVRTGVVHGQTSPLIIDEADFNDGELGAILHDGSMMVNDAAGLPLAGAALLALILGGVAARRAGRRKRH
ncbi:MAG: hypothetical protein GY851_35065 [bacterium]|nr:hypothetical protein [bacterium]